MPDPYAINRNDWSGWYRIVDGVPTQLRWGEYLANPGGIMGTPTATFLRHPDGRVARVSTVYLGLDHQSHPLTGPPVLWETMIFPEDDHDHYQERYTSAQDAEDGHRCAVAGLVDIGWTVDPAAEQERDW